MKDNSFWTRDRFSFTFPIMINNKWKSWKRKRMIKRMFKKPKVSLVFVDRLLLFFIIGTAVFASLVYRRHNLFIERMNEEFQSTSAYGYDIRLEQINNNIYGVKSVEEQALIEELNGGPLSEEDKDIQYDLLMEYVFNRQNTFFTRYMYSQTKIFNADMSEELYKLEENELILQLYNKKKKEKGDYYWYGKLRYVCRDTKLSNQLEEIRSEIKKNRNEIQLIPTMSGAYIKDDYTFLPVGLKIEIVENVEGTNPYPHMEQVCRTVDIDVNLPSDEELQRQGYVYKELDFTHSSLNNAVLELLFTKDLESNALFDSVISLESRTSFFNAVNSSNAGILTEKNGKQIKYTIVTAMENSFLNTYALDFKYIWPSRFELTNREVLFRDLILVISVMLILSIIDTITRYGKLKNIYEINTYRRELTNVMAHDIKTPLMAIRGNAENLQDIHRIKTSSNSITEEKPFVDGIIKNIDYVDTLINKTMSLSQLESGDEVLHKERISIKEVINNAVIRNKTIMEERGINIELFGNDIIVAADKFLLEEAIDNLINNSAKFAAENTGITVELTKKKICFKNQIHDMDSSDIKSLSNAYYKSDKSRSGRNGSGIGLSIVKNIVEIHGWSFKTKIKDNSFITEVILT